MTTSQPQSGRLCPKLIETGIATTVWQLLMSALLMIITAAAAFAQAPTVTVDGPTQITDTSAIIAVTINPNGSSTGFHVQWGSTTAYGQTGPPNVVPIPNAVTNVSAWMTGLSPGTTYHYQLVATNSAGTGYSADMTLTTTGTQPNPQAPTVTVDAPTQIASTNATIAGTINPNGLPTGFFVQWGSTTAYGQAGPIGVVPTQNTVTNVTAWMIGLSPSTTYHYRLVATNSAGNGYSADMTLTTAAGPPPQPPTVTTGSATAITSTNSTITGIVGTSGLPTAYYFRWGTTVAYGNTTPPGSLSGNGSFQVFGGLAGLSPSTTYHYQLVATNSAGSASGDDQSFTTLGAISIDGDFAYTTNAGAITITGYTGPGGAVTIPNAITALPVTAIADNAFFNVTNLTSVSFPETLTSIGGWSFEYCTALTGITLPNGLVNLGFAAFARCSSLENVTLSENLLGLSGAFSGCSKLTRIVIPNSVTYIGSQTLDYCTSLTNVAIGTGVVSIEERAFGSCSNLTSVTIPASTTNIDVNAFSGSTRLAEIIVDSQNSVYRSVDGVLFDKNLTTLILYPEGKFVSNYVVPNGVTNIGPRAFYLHDNLTGITLPETLTSLGDWAFAGCGLTRLALPNSLTNIQDASYVSIGGPFGVFNWCTSLTNVIFGKDLAYLGTGAFTFCTNLVAVYFQGNAPATVGTGGGPFGAPWIFINAPLVTVYYLPGTTGWEPTFSHSPTMLWNPQAQTSDGSFGVQQNRFGFNITGTPDIPLVIEASTDLAARACIGDSTNLAAQAWVPLQSCTLTNGLLYFSDPEWTNYAGRFYRFRSP